MKSLRIKHYGYVLCTFALLLVSIFAIFTGIKTATAEQSPLVITSPAANQKIFQGNQTIRGTGPALKKLTVYDGTKKIGETTADANSEWSLAWPNVKPGQHNLKAYLVDGIEYNANPFSSTSVQASLINNGQTDTGFDAGIASPEGIVYDSANNKSFVLNRTNHTVSIFNMSNNAPDGTITYASSDALAPTDKDSSPCRCANYSYTYDQQNHRLYILDLERIYMINTQNNEVVRSTQVGLVDLDTNGNPGYYQLYVDPAGSYVYLYVAYRYNGNDQAIQRYATDTGQKDENWDELGQDIVGTNTGDVYILRQTYDSEATTAKSLLYKYSQSTQTTAIVDLASTCYNPSNSEIALSTDQSTLYTNCEVDATDTRRLIGVNTSNGQVTNLGADSSWLTRGNLVANRLMFFNISRTYQPGDIFEYSASIESLDTSSNTFQQPLELDDSQYNGDYLYSYLGALDDSFLVSPEGWYAFLSPNNGTIYTIVGSTSTNQMQHVYQSTASALDFYSVRSARRSAFVGADKMAFLAELQRNDIQLLDTSDGTFSKLQYGAGTGIGVYASKLAGRLFSMEELIDEDDSQIPYSGRITVSNLSSGAYEETINLEPLGYISGAVMDSQEQYLYVASTSLTQPNEIIVRKINTQTLAIEHTYNSIQQLTSNGLPYLKLSVVGDELLLSTNSTNVALINLQNDTDRTLTLSSSPLTATAPLGLVAGDPQGGHIAAYDSVEHKVSVIDASTLSVTNTIDVGDGLLTSLGFSTDGNIIIGGASGFGYWLRVYGSDGALKKESSTATFQYANGRVCYVGGLNTTTQEEGYLFTDIYCIPSGSSPNTISKYLEVYDSATLNKLHINEQSETDGINGSSQLASLLLAYGVGHNMVYPEIKTATQTVNVVADSIEITAPAANAKLRKGKHKINGTAPPGKTVTVLVNNQSIGTATSDVYGLWEKEYNFATANTYQIKATYTQPGHTQAYMTHMKMTQFTYATAVVNLETNEVDEDIASPSGLLPVLSFLNSDKSILYVLSMNGYIGTSVSGLSLLAYHASDNSLISNRTIDLGTGDLHMGQPRVSDDGGHIYFVDNSDDTGELVAISTADATVQRIDLGQAYNDDLTNNSSGSSLLGGPVVAEGLHTAYIPYQSTHGLTAVNLESHQVSEFVAPESSMIMPIAYNDQNQTLYVMNIIDNGAQYSITAYSPEDGSVKWSTDVSGDLNVYVGAALSSDKTKLYLVANDFSGSGSGQLNVISVDANSGTVTNQVASDPDGLLNNTGTLFTAGPQSALATLEDTSDSSLYFTIFNPLAMQQGDPENTSILVGYNKANNKVESAFKGSSATDIYARLSGGSFINIVPAEEKSDSVTVSVAAVVPHECNPATDAACKPPVQCTVNCGEPKLPVECNVKTECPIPTIKKKTDRLKKILAGGVAENTTPNQPKALGAVQLFSANLLAKIKQFALSVPTPFVNIFPYLLLLVLATLCGYYLYQSQKQLQREDRMRSLFEKQKVLTEEKRNFLELTSHYLRTPLTYIKAGSEMLLRNDKNDANATELSESVGHLSLFIESLVEEASNTQEKQEIPLPEHTTWSPFLKKSFILPVIGFATVLGLFYLIFGGIGNAHFSTARYITQAGLLFLAGQIFYGMFKNHQNIINEEAYLTQLINNEDRLDYARTKLIKDAGNQLQTRTEHLTALINKIHGQDTNKTIMRQGIERLQELSRAFALVGQLEQGVIEGKMESVSVRTLAAEVIEPMAEKFQAKKVKVEVSGFDGNVTLTTNRPLAEITLKTLLQNALQASKEGSSLVVKCLHKEGRVAFQIIDHGEGIPDGKIERLFKPFVRVGPVTTFNREGIGLSLYLDRLIMHSLGGEVEIMSRFKHGTTATVTFNQKQAA